MVCWIQQLKGDFTMRTTAFLAAIIVWVASPVGAADPIIVPTFECAGLYWKTPAGADHVKCDVRYREVFVGEWHTGFPLWFDGRNHEWGGEYRGSLVHLNPGTSYEVELSAGTQIARTTFQTWPAKFPVGETRALPEESQTPLVIRDSGSTNGYLVFEPGENDTAVIDVSDQTPNCIRIENASHIIIRGLTLRNASTHAIELVGDVHDIVIEDCDISGWGRIDADGWGRNYDSAVFSRSRVAQRIIVQSNQIHHPRGDSNNWTENRPTPRDAKNRHPGGPQAVFLAESLGNHVIRHNTVRSDNDHQFNDIFGAAKNYSTNGFPNRDSDIYGNRLSHCWDDAIESEGANCNVRIWGNYIEKTMVHVATATTSIGPLYIWRNIAGETRQSDGPNSDEIKRGGFLKTSDRMGGGRIYVFHNTLLQPKPPRGFQNTLGTQIGLGHGGAMSNVVSRNNIFQTSSRGGPFNDRTKDPLGDYDYDLHNGRLQISSHEQNGFAGLPTFESTEGQPAFVLSASSLGVDSGVKLPNFNDGYTGKAPDIGAHETNSSIPTFGAK